MAQDRTPKFAVVVAVTSLAALLMAADPLVSQPPRDPAEWIRLRWKEADQVQRLKRSAPAAAAPSGVDACPSRDPSKTAGVGFVPPPGSQACLYKNWTDRTVSCYPMDLSAHPYSDRNRTNEELNALSLRRYGLLHVGGEYLLVYDAENYGKVGSPWVTGLCCQDAFGTRSTHNCYPTDEELTDYLVTHADGKGGGGGSVSTTPGQPAITTILSPVPGRIALTWRTRTHDAFEVEAGPVTVRVPGDKFSTELDLPEKYGGIISVTVQAFLGETGGKKSLPKEVRVEPRAGGSEPPTPPVDPRCQGLCVSGVCSCFDCPGECVCAEDCSVGTPAPCGPSDASSCEGFLEPVRASLEGCEGRVRELEAKLLQAPAKPAVPEDVLLTLRNAPTWKRWGPGQTARWRRALDWLCSVSECPKGGI